MGPSGPGVLAAGGIARPKSARPLVSPDARIRQAALLVISPDGHTDDARLQDAFRLLRAEAPVCWVECPGFKPFWLITRYADVATVERRGAPFIAGPRSVLSSEAGEASMRQISGKPDVLRSLFQMDEPEHRAYRGIVSPWFAQAGLSGLHEFVASLAQETLARAAAWRDTFDFATEVAVSFPLRVMMHILGLPPEDDAHVLHLSRGIMGAEDPGRRLSERPAESIRLAGIGLRDYFDAVTQDRRTFAANDLSSAIANARIEGRPIPDYERLSYFMQLAIAGQENTAFCLAGGLHALSQHPTQLARLQSEPALTETAVEEMFRWTSPGRHLMRTATADIDIGGQLIRAGEAVAVFFNSANRDETVFQDADKFDVGRCPNPHLAFGLGHHFCLGAHLARLELRRFFEVLVPKLLNVELAGTPRRARSAVISGFTCLPVRWVLSA